MRLSVLLLPVLFGTANCAHAQRTQHNADVVIPSENNNRRGGSESISTWLGVASYTNVPGSPQDQDVFVPIGKYIQQGDSESLSAWFASNLELDILGNVNDCSKIQATQIIKDFFVTYKPKNFSIIHKSGKAPMKYAIGTLNAGGETFRVTLFVKTQSNGNQIQQLRIERE